jgi:hypothetical protein
MVWQIPVLQSKHTLYAIVYGAVLLAWLSTENATVIIVSLLGAGLSLMLISLGLMRWFGGRTVQQWLLVWIILGAMVGCGAVVTTIGLMVFKNAWHSHAYPDFASVVVADMARRFFPWTAAGGLLGGATALIRLATYP